MTRERAPRRRLSFSRAPLLRAPLASRTVTSPRREHDVYRAAARYRRDGAGAAVPKENLVLLDDDSFIYEAVRSPCRHAGVLTSTRSPFHLCIEMYSSM